MPHLANHYENSAIMLKDRVQAFRLEHIGTRGRLVRLGPTLDAVFTHHDYPMAVAELVAEAVLLTALIGQAIKLRWKLSLQIRGNGPVRLIATDFHAPSRKGAPGRLRAYSGFDDILRQPDAGSGIELLGEGYFAVIIDQGKDLRPYQGITPLAGKTLARCAETFFYQSEQLPSLFRIAISGRTGDDARTTWHGGGLMMQQLPPGKGNTADSDHEDAWERMRILLDSATPDEMIGPDVSPEQLIVRLFHSENPQISEAFPVAFGCTCSPERVRQSLSIYSARDISTMTNSDGKVTADCQFCGAHYEFEPGTLGFEART